MAETQVLGWGTQTAPASRTTSDRENFVLQAIQAIWDGTAAGTTFVPVVEVYSDAGVLVARHVATASVSAGGSAEVTFAPFLGRGSTGVTPPTAGIQFGTYPQSGSWLEVHTTSSDPNRGGAQAMYFSSAGFNDITFESGGDWVAYAHDGASLFAGYSPSGPNGTHPQMFLASNGRIVVITGDDYTFQVTRESDAFVVFQTLARPGDTTSGVTINLEAGYRVLVTDRSGNSIFRIDEDGALHGKTGKSLVFDL